MKDIAIPNDIIEEAVEYLDELAIEWGYKRNSTNKNNRIMVDLDALILKLKGYAENPPYYNCVVIDEHDHILA